MRMSLSFCVQEASMSGWIIFVIVIAVLVGLAVSWWCFRAFREKC